MQVPTESQDPLAQRIREIAAKTPLPDFLQKRIDAIPPSERSKYLVVFDADGVLWKEDIAGFWLLSYLSTNFMRLR